MGRPVFSAANYTILGRLLFYLPYLSPLHPGRVLSTFLGLDAIIEAITINGVARLANSDLPPSHQSVGGALVKAGLISQVVISLLFMVTVGVFHWNCHFHFQRRRPSTTTTTTSSPSLGSASASASASEEGSGKYHLQRPVPPSRKLKRIIKTLYISTILIIIRSIYGIVTAWDGLRARQQRTIPGVINRQEWFFWTWDGIAMLMNIYLWNLYYPGRYLPSDCKVYLSPNGDGVTETMGPGWKDERKWWVTVLDPFDFVGIVMGRDKKLGKFWEEEQEREREAEERRKRDLEMGSEGGEEGGKDGNGKGGKSKGEKDQKSWLGRIVQAISEHNLVAGG
ncbi:MAG: hypothetical protein M1823_003744 [Watsoniomyces obsoletus]|nr:MAG: hypothetical protein M1823_003744 [Watsoniomyces obsoletus]